MKTTYLYQAKSKSSYEALAGHILCCGAILTINPRTQTISVTVDSDEMRIIDEIRGMIADHGLEFDETPVTRSPDSDLNRTVEQLAEELNVVKAEAKQYSQWYYRKAEELEKIRKQVNALQTIIVAGGCLFPTPNQSSCRPGAGKSRGPRPPPFTGIVWESSSADRAAVRTQNGRDAAGRRFKSCLSRYRRREP